MTPANSETGSNDISTQTLRYGHEPHSRSFSQLNIKDDEETMPRRDTTGSSSTDEVKIKFDTRDEATGINFIL
jgi:hypothetical protein